MGKAGWMGKIHMGKIVGDLGGVGVLVMQTVTRAATRLSVG
jgi:hypothetical protein